MPERVPPDAAVLAGCIPPLIVQRQALPVRNGKVGLAPLTCDGPTVRAIHETATGRTDVVLSDGRRMEMPPRHGADEKQVRLDDSGAFVSQLGECLPLGFANEVEQDGSEVRVKGQLVLRVFRLDQLRPTMNDCSNYLHTELPEVDVRLFDSQDFLNAKPRALRE